MGQTALLAVRLLRACCAILVLLALPAPSLYGDPRHSGPSEAGRDTGDEGLFGVSLTEGRLVFEIPAAALGRDMLIVTRLARTSLPASTGFGGDEVHRQVVRWVLQGERVVLLAIDARLTADSSAPVFHAVDRVRLPAIVRAFPLIGRGENGSVKIDVSQLFLRDTPGFGLDAGRRQRARVQRADEARSHVTDARSYPENVNVRAIVTYDLIQQAAGPMEPPPPPALTVELLHSIVLLPAVPMRPRFADSRVGFFTEAQTSFSASDIHSVEERVIWRWRLEPRDTAAFRQGRAVEPTRPIVFYLDPAIPERWRPYIRQGVEDWAPALEAAGFRNAISVRDAPTSLADRDFVADDVRYSVIRWIPSDFAVAQGHSFRDPRTGEILSASIRFNHGLVRHLRNSTFATLAAVHPGMRGAVMADSALGSAVRVLVAHEVGHTLGLRHNLVANAAFPVDSLRSAAFTRRHGISASTMDYLRGNNVAQPGDDGVELFPRIGAYDIHAIRWGYRPILEASTPGEETVVLRRWLAERENDPAYTYGELLPLDPRDHVYVAGNDAVRAGELVLANLRRTMDKLEEWTGGAAGDPDYIHEIYTAVRTLAFQVRTAVLRSIGGVYEPLAPGQPYRPVPAAEQRRALAFLSKHYLHPLPWLVQPSFLMRTGAPETLESQRRQQDVILRELLDAGRLQRIIEAQVLLGPAAYALDEHLAVVRRAVWDVPSDVYSRQLQRMYLERYAALLGVGGSGATTQQTPGPTRVFLPISEIRPALLVDLRVLHAEIESASVTEADDTARAHMEWVIKRIDALVAG